MTATARRSGWILAALTGLVLVFFVARSLAFRAIGFDPGRASLDSDCDQCVLTATLDVLPVVAAACAAYLLLVLVAFLVARRRAPRRTEGPGRA